MEFKKKRVLGSYQRTSDLGLGKGNCIGVSNDLVLDSDRYSGTDIIRSFENGSSIPTWYFNKQNP